SSPLKGLGPSNGSQACGHGERHRCVPGSDGAGQCARWRRTARRSLWEIGRAEIGTILSFRRAAPSPRWNLVSRGQNSLTGPSPPGGGGGGGKKNPEKPKTEINP